MLNDNIDWTEVTDQLNRDGYALVKNLVSTEICESLIQSYPQNELYRKTVSMERHRFGRGEYKYFQYPLPAAIQNIRERVYPKLAQTANTWMRVLKIDQNYPESFNDFQHQCHKNGQTKPTALILKYGQGDFNTLHQDLYGEIFFPIQLVLFLSDPESDYNGGEFVLTKQIPRAQSKAIILKPAKTDALLLTTSFKPEKGVKGYYRVNMKHGVSEVLHGNRYTVGVIFHDALT